MSPGPLFAANVFYGLKGGAKAGLKMAYGHTVVELPLVILLGIGAFSLETIPEFRTYIAIIGAAIGLFIFAGIQLKQVFKNKFRNRYNEPKHGPFVAGILLSALNPFFIIWWLTIGFKLISDALIIWSFWGILIMFLLHIWMDYAMAIIDCFSIIKDFKNFIESKFQIFNSWIKRSYGLLWIYIPN